MIQRRRMAAVKEWSTTLQLCIHNGVQRFSFVFQTQWSQVGWATWLPTKTFKDLRRFLILHEMVGKQKNVCPATWLAQS